LAGVLAGRLISKCLLAIVKDKYKDNYKEYHLRLDAEANSLDWDSVVCASV
jgi:hypothetical protein